MLQTVLISALVSLIVSNLTAAHHFNVIDGYVRDMIELAKEEIKKAYFICSKHLQNRNPKR